MGGGPSDLHLYAIPARTDQHSTRPAIPSIMFILKQGLTVRKLGFTVEHRFIRIIANLRHEITIYFYYNSSSYSNIEHHLAVS